MIKLDTQGKNIEISAPAPLLRLKVLLEFTLISTSELESNNHLTCDKPYRKVPEPYVVTQIRRNIGLFKKKMVKRK